MQDKTTRLADISSGVGLRINKDKSKVMRINTNDVRPVTLGGQPLEEVDSFTYLGSIVDKQGGTDMDAGARIGKARAAFIMLKNIWNSKVIGTQTKLRIFNSDVKSVLFYGSQTWRRTEKTLQRIQTFINRCLRRIFNIWWPEIICNEELWQRGGQEPVIRQILRRKWGWIGYTLHKKTGNVTHQSLFWNSQGKRRRGRPNNSWRRNTETEVQRMGFSLCSVLRHSHHDCTFPVSQ